VNAPPGRSDPGLLGHAVGDAVKPAGNGSLLVDGIGLAGEDQERALEGIFGIVIIAEDMTAHVPDQRAVSVDERGEGAFVPRDGEPLQQRRVAKVPDRSRIDELAQVSHQGTALPFVHQLASGERFTGSYIVPGRPEKGPGFFFRWRPLTSRPSP
jgi:hypothetical protein